MLGRTVATGTFRSARLTYGNIPQSHPSVTRADAKRLGLTRYFTGKPCKRGHVAERVLTTGFCIECRREWDRKWSQDNPEKVHTKAQKRYATNKEEMLAKSKAWARLHPESNRRYCETHKDEINERRRDRHAANPERKREYKRKHRAENNEKYRQRDRRAAPSFAIRFCSARSNGSGIILRK
jgi:hypothetical protein